MRVYFKIARVALNSSHFQCAISFLSLFFCFLFCIVLYVFRDTKLHYQIVIICTYYDLGVVKLAFLFHRETDAFLYCCDFSPRAIQLVKVNISNIAWPEYTVHNIQKPECCIEVAIIFHYSTDLYDLCCMKIKKAI